MAWFYAVLLAVASLGILAYALVLTRRLFRDGADLEGAGAPGRGATEARR